MNTHKNTRLTPYSREDVRNHYIWHSGGGGGPCQRWFSCRDRRRSGCDGSSLHGVRVNTQWASFHQVRHEAGHGGGESRSTGHRACTRRRWRDGGGFVELLVPGALAPLDVAILFGAAWLNDLHGHAALLEEFLECATELGAVVGLAPRMTTGKVSRMRSKAARMLWAERVVTSSVAVSFETRSQTVN